MHLSCGGGGGGGRSIIHNSKTFFWYRFKVNYSWGYRFELEATTYKHTMPLADSLAEKIANFA